MQCLHHLGVRCHSAGGCCASVGVPGEEGAQPGESRVLPHETALVELGVGGSVQRPLPPLTPGTPFVQAPRQASHEPCGAGRLLRCLEGEEKEDKYKIVVMTEKDK